VIAGPSIRCTEERVLTLGPDLVTISDELALVGSGSPALKSAYLELGVAA
jgi:IclR family acetate operon transcriptional repressor